MRWKARIARELFTPVDASTVALFRIGFGAILLHWAAGILFTGLLPKMFILPAYHFTYAGFGWVRPLPGIGMYAVFALLVASCAGVMLGLFYRVSAPLFAVLVTYVFLLDRTNYQNHWYLICLLGAILAVVPAHRALSLDARLWPSPDDGQLPGWGLFLLRFQIAVPYVFGGLLKLSSDWLLHAQPMRVLLTMRARSLPSLAFLLSREWLAYFMSWTGMLFDLSIVPALMWRRSRPFAVAALVIFHLTNSLLFNIDVFPWLMLASTPIFFEPDWGRRVLVRLFRSKPAPIERPARARVVVLLALWIAIQIGVPLRRFAVPGNVHWHEVGLLFTWNMLLKWKDGHTDFEVTDEAAQRSYTVNLARYLHPHQIRNMWFTPQMIWQFSQFLADRLSNARIGRVQVRVGGEVSFNGRPPQPLIDPAVDLAAAPDDPLAWVVPLAQR